MATEWFDVEAGSDIGQGRDDPRMLIVPVGKPDRIRLPKELGGTEVRCLEVIAAPCLMPGHENETARHFILEGEVQMFECPSSGQFIWYRRRQPKTT